MKDLVFRCMIMRSDALGATWTRVSSRRSFMHRGGEEGSADQLGRSLADHGTGCGKRRAVIKMGVDEKSLDKGHNYLTTDIWDAYLASIRDHVPQSKEKLVFDRYHLMTHMIKAFDTVRKEEQRELREKERNLLIGAKYLQSRLARYGWDYRDPELPPNHFGQSASRPEVGGIAKSPGSLEQEIDVLPLLRQGEFGALSPRLLRVEARSPSFPIGSLPSDHRAYGGLYFCSHRRYGYALREQLDGFAAAFLQLCRASWRSHASEYDSTKN